VIKALAEKADAFIKQRLMQLARNYKRRISLPAKTEEAPHEQK
jgi:hypothetical protein